jgi:hypothetical protein
LLGAMLFAVSAALQQHAARSTARGLSSGRIGGRAGAGTRERVVAVPRGSALGGRVPLERIAPEADRQRLRVSALLVRLARHPLWLLGWLAGLVGFGAQAMALHLGSIIVVPDTDPPWDLRWRWRWASSGCSSSPPGCSDRVHSPAPPRLPSRPASASA